ncbi:PEP-CTERM sorting domain-containing protein [Erythrobacter crassostreae]|uniref:PEP-CTERM sorting domain-containing protein n=1 Tax=Erythrobacter crassostreae TaxID=2828328 RepID=A0A9X1F4R3_9SPHN|nr:PEP-CTERM sorting domain-containing protein [Erythrobacter crassostrea]MBV7259941.1 PEP-CTERM sorting domain-containing protein [Erythrobacter crassostrea]
MFIRRSIRIGLGGLVLANCLSAPALAADDMTSGNSSNGSLVTSSTSSTTGTLNPNLPISSTGGTSTTSGFCIPGGLGCGPDSGLTPIGTEVPEPSALALMLLGLGLIAGRSLRRRRKLAC